MKQVTLPNQPEWIAYYLKTDTGDLTPVARPQVYGGNASAIRKRREASGERST